MGLRSSLARASRRNPSLSQTPSGESCGEVNDNKRILLSTMCVYITTNDLETSEQDSLALYHVESVRQYQSMLLVRQAE